MVKSIFMSYWLSMAIYLIIYAIFSVEKGEVAASIFKGTLSFFCFEYIKEKF